MEFKFFNVNFNTPIEECKRQYHELVKRYHPDLGGDEEKLKAVNAEWKYLQSHNYNVHEDKNGNVYTDERQEAPDDVTERFADILSALVRMDGVGIEVCGSFIWLSGNTRPHKDEIKKLGFKWASKKKLWYLAPSSWRKTGRNWSMERIRERHGSLVVTEGQTDGRNALVLA